MRILVIEDEKRSYSRIKKLLLQTNKKKYRERFLIPIGDHYQIVNTYAINHFVIEKM